MTAEPFPTDAGARVRELEVALRRCRDTLYSLDDCDGQTTARAPGEDKYDHRRG